MKNTCKIYFVIFILLTLLACGSGARKAKPGVNPEKRTLAESKFDPMGEEGDENIITTEVPQAREADSAGDVLSIPKRPEAVKQENQYFSVQLFASKSNNEAKEFKNSISNLFKEEVRIDYQAPYYRVCVGKVDGFDQGEDLLRKVNAMGYPKAWLVRIRK